MSTPRRLRITDLARVATVGLRTRKLRAGLSDAHIRSPGRRGVATFRGEPLGGGATRSPFVDG